MGIIQFARESRSVLYAIDFRPHRYVRQEHIDEILPCDDLNKWASAGGSTSYATGGDCLCSGSNHRSLKMVANEGSDSYFRYDYQTQEGELLDLTDGSGNPYKVIVVRVKILPADGTIVNPQCSSSVQLKLNLWNDGYTNLSSNVIWQADMVAPSDDLPGWYEIPFPACELDDSNNTDFSAIRYISIQFNALGDKVGWVLDRILIFHPPNSVGGWILRTDGSNERALHVAEYAASKGVRISFGINTLEVGTSGNLTAQQVRYIQQAGHEICVYTRTNPTWFEKSYQQKVQAIETSMQWFRENGIYPAGARHLCLSGLRGWTPADEENFKGKYGLVISGRPFIPRRLTSLWDASRLDIKGFIDTGQIPDLNNQITKAENNKAIFVAGAHYANDDQVGWIEDFIDAMVSSSLKNYTLDDVAMGRVQ